MKTKRQLIAFFAGGKRLGKSTAAQKMKEELEARGKKVIIVNFAGVLREVCTDILGAFGIGPDIAASLLTEGKDDMEMGLSPYRGVSPAKLVSPRTGLLEPVGQSIRERIGENAWVSALERRIDMLPADIDVVLIDDLRKVNEAAFVHENGGELVFVDRPEFWDKLDMSSPDAVHAFEIRHRFPVATWSA